MEILSFGNLWEDVELRTTLCVRIVDYTLCLEMGALTERFLKYKIEIQVGNGQE